LLYVKESNIDPAFWGLNEPQLSRLRGSGQRWYIVLLVANGERGYFINGTLLKGGWSIGGDDYKLHPNELSDWTPFSFYADLFRAILEGS
jgi:hypothetical protein